MDDLTRAALDARRMQTQHWDHSRSRGDHYEMPDERSVDFNVDTKPNLHRVLRERDEMEWRVRHRYEDIWEDAKYLACDSRHDHEYRDNTRSGRNLAAYPYASPKSQRRQHRAQYEYRRPLIEPQSFSPPISIEQDYRTREVRPDRCEETRQRQRAPPHQPRDPPQSSLGSTRHDFIETREVQPDSRAPDRSHLSSSQQGLAPGYNTALAESRRAIEAFLNDEYDPPPPYSSPRRRCRKDKRRDIRAKDHQSVLSWLAGRRSLGGNRRG